MKTITIKTDGNICEECPCSDYDEEDCFTWCRLGMHDDENTPGPDCPGSGEYVLVEKQKHLNMEAQICDMETGGDE